MDFFGTILLMYNDIFYIVLHLCFCQLVLSTIFWINPRRIQISVQYFSKSLCHRGTFSSDGFYTNNANREFCNVTIWFSRTITYLTISAGTPSGWASTYFLIPARRAGSCLARCSNLWTDRYKSEETFPKRKSTKIKSI